jgi:hypothetical protein
MSSSSESEIRTDYESESQPGDARPASGEILNWPTVWLVFAVGTILTVASIVVSVAYNWSGIWPQVLLAWGTTIALSAVFFGVQRLFVRRVRQEVVSVGEQLGGRLTRLEDVAGLVNQGQTQRYAEEDKPVEALKENVDHESVQAALDKALDLGAISEGFRVRLGHPIDGLRLTFDLKRDPKGGHIFDQVGTWLAQNLNASVSEYWFTSTPAKVVFENLQAALGRKHINIDKEGFDVAFALQNLYKSLIISIQARRGQLSRPRNPVIEIVDSRWAFTEAGLESLTDDFSLSDEKFPQKSAFGNGVIPEKYKRPQTPPNVDQGDWAMLMTVAEGIYPWPRPFWSSVFPST